MELIQWEIPALLWEKRNSIVKFSKRVPTKIEQVCPNLTEVISEQTSNLPFLHALERQSKGKFPPFCPRRGLDPNCRGGRKVGRKKNTSWFELSNCTKDAFEKARKGREFDTKAKAFAGEGFEPFFAEERVKGAAMLGRLSHFRAHADKKGGLGGPSRWKTASKEGPRQIWQAEGRRGHIWPRKGQKGPASSRTRHRSPLSFEKEQSSLRSLFFFFRARVPPPFLPPPPPRALLLLLSSPSLDELLPSFSFPSVDSLAGDRGGIHSCTHSQNALCARLACMRSLEDCAAAKFGFLGCNGERLASELREINR